MLSDEIIFGLHNSSTLHKWGGGINIFSKIVHYIIVGT